MMAAMYGTILLSLLFISAVQSFSLGSRVGITTSNAVFPAHSRHCATHRNENARVHPSSAMMMAIEGEYRRPCANYVLIFHQSVSYSLINYFLYSLCSF